jgi:hypothetical protein
MPGIEVDAIYGEMETEGKIRQEKLQFVGAQPWLLPLYNRAAKAMAWTEQMTKGILVTSLHMPCTVGKGCVEVHNHRSTDKLLSTCSFVLQQTLMSELINLACLNY